MLTSFESRVPIGFVAENGIIAFYTRGAVNPLGSEVPSYKIAPQMSTNLFNPEVPKKNDFLDIRQVLYWNEDLETDEDGDGSFSFTLSDHESSFLIEIAGIVNQQYIKEQMIIKVQNTLSSQKP